MELRHLEHFVAVAEERNFTRAARRLHLVQSALSVSIRSLERELGARLFERTTREVRLTDAGRVLLPEARRTLDAAASAAGGGLRRPGRPARHAAARHDAGDQRGRRRLADRTVPPRAAACGHPAQDRSRRVGGDDLRCPARRPGRRLRRRQRPGPAGADGDDAGLRARAARLPARSPAGPPRRRLGQRAGRRAVRRLHARDGAPARSPTSCLPGQASSGRSASRCRTGRSTRRWSAPGSGWPSSRSR